MSAPTRPVLRYHGGKWQLAPWVIGFFPSNRVYVEPFGGAGSVLLRKPRSYAEVYNDLEEDVVNVFRVLRNPSTAQALRCAVALTPYARSEYHLARRATDLPVERARRTVVRAYLGFGSPSVALDYSTGFRSKSNRNGAPAAADWANWPSAVPAWVDRLRGVVIEQRDASEVIQQQDGPSTLFYCDPPYVHATRRMVRRKAAAPRRGYVHEMTDVDHRRLAELLHDVRGMVVLSGYPCDLYDRELYAGWERHERRAFADGARARTEVVWLNPACSAALAAERAQISLFPADAPAAPAKEEQDG
jgi:DNA adenine methylase